ncbi:hypothetical protein SAMN05660405_02328 [Psychrobacter pacificensis]|uniref:PRTase-CE domain-containing protein n=1 Tax=Psychrobacter pacificensis TaxID=112002 RepID=A0A1G7A4W0_9GAMM|nr:hypothetical protein [Psychrobacter pacificensis]GLR28679.1 hypothetical protein GCM10007915_09170 [Psychrobacter pacificensis]SDE09968.1 hypothetical protein SAMN05660405_02328 [Psychrobacter pacificensis]
MEELAHQISEIILCYREDDIDGCFYNTVMTPEHVINWVNQFDENDREFLLSELLHILPKSYFSKAFMLKFLDVVLTKVSVDLGYENLYNFLLDAQIIQCQGSKKSQTEILILLDEIFKDKFGKSIKDFPLGDVKYWIYIDDLLASGGTFKRNIIKEIEHHALDGGFKNSNVEIVCLFIGLHSLGWKNTKYSLNQALSWNVSERIKAYMYLDFENNIKETGSKLNIVYPKKNEEGLNFLDFLEGSFVRDYPMRNENIAFRPLHLPITEEFYSSPQSRDRYENILLRKGIDLIHNTQNLTVESIRPLGMTNPSNKTLGTGSHFFTWRNISNTCPIVFWWEANDWYPLFPVKNRGV